MAAASCLSFSRSFPLPLPPSLADVVLSEAVVIVFVAVATTIFSPACYYQLGRSVPHSLTHLLRHWWSEPRCAFPCLPVLFLFFFFFQLTLARCWRLSSSPPVVALSIAANSSSSSFVIILSCSSFLLFSSPSISHYTPLWQQCSSTPHSLLSPGS